jgi:ribosomal protein L15
MDILSLMLSYSNAWKLTAKIILIVVVSVMLAATIVLLGLEFFAMRQKKRSAILHNGVAAQDEEKIESNLVETPIFVEPDFVQSEVEIGEGAVEQNDFEQGEMGVSAAAGISDMQDLTYDQPNSPQEPFVTVPCAETNEEASVPQTVQNEAEMREIVAEAEEQAEQRLAAQAPKRGGKKRKAVAIINVDTIAKNFEADEVVTLEALHQKGLLPKNANSFKLLGRGEMDKPITIVCDDHSMQAKKLISSCGGNTILRKSPMDQQ